MLKYTYAEPCFQRITDSRTPHSKKLLMSYQLMKIVKFLNISWQWHPLLILAREYDTSQKPEFAHFFLKFYGGNRGILFPFVREGHNLYLKQYMLSEECSYSFFEINMCFFIIRGVKAFHKKTGFRVWHKTEIG